MAQNLPNQDDEDEIDDQGAGLPPQLAASLAKVGAVTGGSPDAGDDDSDSIASSAAAPAASPAPSSPAQIPMLTAGELQNAVDQKRKLGLMGALADNLANRQSFGNFFLGRMNPHVDASAPFAQAQNAVTQGIQNKLALQKQAMMAPEMQYAQQMGDPNSTLTNLTKLNTLSLIDRLKTSPFLKNNPEAQSNYDQLADQIRSGNMNGYALHQVIDGDPALKSAMAEDAQGARMLAMMDMMNKRLENTNVNKAQTIANNDPILKTYIPRLDGAQKVLNLIDAAQSGKFKSNKAMLGQLNNEIARLETGSQSPGLGQAEKTEMNDTAASLKDIYDTMTGKVTNVDLSAKFAQARGMVRDLGQSYYNQINDRMNTLKAGAMPDQLPVFEAKHNGLNYTYRNFAPQDEAPQMLTQGGGAPAAPGISAPQAPGKAPSLFPSAQAATPQDPNITQWAKAHGLPYDQAVTIIQNRLRGKNGS